MSVAPGSQASTFVELLRSLAEERPDVEAAVFLDEVEREAGRATYADLDRRARAVAAELARRGLVGERALLAIPPGIDCIATVYGCFYAGVVAVTSPPPDPSRELAAPRIRKVADDSDPRVVLTTTEVEPAIRDVLADRRTGGGPFVAVDAPELASAEEWEESRPRPDDVALLQYTSGSTRLPRGVVITHDRLLANCGAVHRAFGIGAGDRMVTWLPPFHDMGLISAVFQPVYSGIPLTELAPATFAVQPMSWLRAISTYRGTISGAPNFGYELVVKRTSPRERATVDLSAWQLAYNGSELVRSETMDAFSEAFSPAGFRRTAFYPCYGLAEATLIVSGGDRGDPPVSHEAPPVVGCGKAVADTRIAIVDAESGAELAEGELGEIWVAGPGVAMGYWGRDAEAAPVFRAELAGDDGGRRYLRTGDLGFVVGDELFVTGRIADLIVVDGSAHYATDLERAATDAVAELRTGCAAAFQVVIGGEERVALVAEARDEVEAEGAIEAARVAVSGRFGVELAMVALIAPRTIPRTTSGKIRRGRCRVLFESGQLATVAAWSESQ